MHDLKASFLSTCESVLLYQRVREGVRVLWMIAEEVFDCLTFLMMMVFSSHLSGLLFVPRNLIKSVIVIGWLPILMLFSRSM